MFEVDGILAGVYNKNSTEQPPSPNTLNSVKAFYYVSLNNLTNLQQATTWL